jgi:DNA-binding response OmpR family regulator
MPMVKAKLARILLVDDEAIVRETVSRALCRDYEILALPSAETLERAMERFRPDLTILDVRMPGEDGWKVCRRLRQQKRYDPYPVIFMSALADEASVRQGFACGGDFYLPKPFDLQVLSRAVETFIGRKHRYPNESH